MPDMIRVDGLVKIYSDGTKAINGATFSVKAGEIYGFLGPNGAGKSTTIKVLTTLIQATEGSVMVDGFDIGIDAKSVRKVIGVQNQDTSVDGDLTGRENLLLQGHLQRMHGDELRCRTEELLDLMSLIDVADKKVNYYSSGMKRRLDIASALIHSPKLLFLDEPTVGLDPQSRGKIWNYLQKIRREDGVTIFLSTHYLDEADRLCDRISIIDQGSIIITGSPNELKQQIGGDRISLELSGADGELEMAMNVVGRVSGIAKVQAIENGLAMYTKNGAGAVPEIVRALDGKGIVPLSVSVQMPTLDDVFLQRTGKSIRTEPLSKNRKKRRIPFH